MLKCPIVHPPTILWEIYGIFAFLQEMYGIFLENPVNFL